MKFRNVAGLAGDTITGWRYFLVNIAFGPLALILSGATSGLTPLLFLRIMSKADSDIMVTAVFYFLSGIVTILSIYIAAQTTIKRLKTLRMNVHWGWLALVPGINVLLFLYLSVASWKHIRGA